MNEISVDGERKDVFCIGDVCLSLRDVIYLMSVIGTRLRSLRRMVSRSPKRKEMDVI